MTILWAVVVSPEDNALLRDFKYVLNVSLELEVLAVLPSALELPDFFDVCEMMSDNKLVASVVSPDFRSLSNDVKAF